MALSDLGAVIGSVIMGIILQISNYQTIFLNLVFAGFINLSYFLFIVKERREDRYAHL